ncbi:MAG: SAM-dependent methyltransferase [Deltaproteobacteria bacterium]|nr:SAM-dependent methyltransferase [Deltaproteobacteria bacterium]
MNPLPEPMLDELVTCAAELTGFSREAILPESVRRAIAPFLHATSPAQLVARARQADLEVTRALCQAVSVGETFFFRQPEHFEYLAHALLPERVRQGTRRFTAWSAGCATGEETWSLAACLRDMTAGTCIESLDVLGTDLLARNVSAARMGVYGAWSKREIGPILHPLFEPGFGDKPPLRVHERLRIVTRFHEHNLLDAPPGEGFDVIFCRNVLVYFAPAQARLALGHLARALSPQGVLVLGAMDAPEAPAGMERVGPAESQVWRRLPPEALRKAPELPPHLQPPLHLDFAVPGVPPLVHRPPEPVALHVRALLLVERGERALATAALSELVKVAPDYVPGLLERALWHAREGERNAAATLMREILRRTDGLPLEALLPAPEPLPVGFFRESAEAWLKSARPSGGAA